MRRIVLFLFLSATMAHGGGGLPIMLVPVPTITNLGETPRRDQVRVNTDQNVPGPKFLHFWQFTLNGTPLQVAPSLSDELLGKGTFSEKEGLSLWVAQELRLRRKGKPLPDRTYLKLEMEGCPAGYLCGRLVPSTK